MTSAVVSSRAIVAEALGTGLLVTGVIGSGILATNLTADVGLQLLCNAVATGALLTVLILIFAPVSGAAFNPVVTLVAVCRRQVPIRTAIFFVVAQIAGAIAGTAAAHLMFGLDIFALGTHARGGWNMFLAEAVATFGLVLIILGCRGRQYVAGAVGLYITAAYWFTASTSFANPAVTIARALTATFAGISPSDVPGFIGAQIAGGLLAALLGRWLFEKGGPAAEILPRGEG